MSVVHTKLRPRIKNHRMISGLIYLAIAGVVLMTILGTLRRLPGGFRAGNMADNLSAVLMLYGPMAFMVILAVGVVVIGVRGLSYLFLPSLPERIPDQFLHGPRLREDLLKQQLAYPGPPDHLLFRAMRSFGNHRVEWIATMLRPAVLSAAKGFSGSFWIAALFVGLAVAPLDKIELPAGVVLDFRIPGPLLAAAVVIAVLYLVLLVVLLPRRSPAVDFHRKRISIRTAGHPQILINDLQDAVDRFRFEEIPNRVVVDNETTLKEESAKDVGTVRGGTFLETQPVPEDGFQGELRLLGYLATIAGGVLWLVCAIMTRGGVESALSGVLHGGGNLMVPVGPVLAGLAMLYLLMRNGGRMFGIGDALVSRRIWTSHLFDIAVDGRYFRGEIGAGMAMDDSFRTRSTVLKTEGYLDLHSSRVISESFGFGMREPVEMTDSDQLRGQMSELVEAAEEHLSRGESLVGIEIGDSRASSEITSANVAIQQRKQEPAPSPPALEAAETARIAAGEGGEEPASTDGMKECPDCAEMVREKARKCRFCGLIFEPVEG